MNRKILFRYAVIFFVIIETLSIIRGYVIVRDWIPMFTMLAVSLLFYPKSFFNKETFFLLLYLVVLVSFAFMGHTMGTRRWIANEILGPLTCLSVINVFLYNRDFHGLKIVTLVGLIIIVVTSVLTLFIVTKDPHAVRDMARSIVAGKDIRSIQLYQRTGLASFGLVHALPFLYPVLIFHVKAKGKIVFRFCCFCAVVVTFIMVLKTHFTTPLILSTFGILCALFLSQNQGRNLLLGIFLSMFCVLFVNDNILIYGLRTIQPFFQNTLTAEKIDDVILSITLRKKEGDVKRIDASIKSWKTFLRSPFYGNFDKKQAGGHAYFLDRLAYFGFVGAIPFFMFFYYMFKKIFLLLDSARRTCFLVSILIFFILGCLKNISGIENVLYLFIFLPGLCFDKVAEP